MPAIALHDGYRMNETADLTKATRKKVTIEQWIMFSATSHPPCVTLYKAFFLFLYAFGDDHQHSPVTRHAFNHFSVVGGVER